MNKLNIKSIFFASSFISWQPLNIAIGQAIIQGNIWWFLIVLVAAPVMGFGRNAH